MQFQDALLSKDYICHGSRPLVVLCCSVSKSFERTRHHALHWEASRVLNELVEIAHGLLCSKAAVDSAETHSMFLLHQWSLSALRSAMK